jgi:hypothetical protein
MPAHAARRQEQRPALLKICLSADQDGTDLVFWNLLQRLHGCQLQVCQLRTRRGLLLPALPFPICNQARASKARKPAVLRG